ncbi:hypothetical protein MCUN1_000254 [Malassezia cuniculi]|uniref:mRNA-decapping enzyme 1B n=1 Tax=Malassezia cuniculi TaxID=948313 RepID=A0AAF0EN76_9BASI|nr:hypothetical protein MCUN1_000254 [Malassezia cuniculi]
MDLDARHELNLRVLRRFDPSITRIVSVASFAVLYSYENEWAKTSTEGPLFLFQRESAPHGLLILNRNGPVSFSIDIRTEDDIEVSNEFIIYHPNAHPDAEDDVYGIWIFEHAQLEQLGKLMIDLQHDRIPPLPVQPQGDSILDSLFQQQGAAHKFSEAEQAGASILNELFVDAAAQLAPSADEGAGAAPQGVSINIDELFAGLNTSTADSDDDEEFEEVPEAPSIELPDTRDASPSAVEPTHTQEQLVRADEAGLPSSSGHHESAAARLSSAPATSKPLPAAPSTESPLALLNDTRAETRLPRHPERLSRREFVQHLMTLLYMLTGRDTTYVDQLYARYLAQYDNGS